MPPAADLELSPVIVDNKAIPLFSGTITMKNIAERQQVIDTCLQMEQRGINQGTSGNVSLRVADGLLITPSGMPYRDMGPADIVYLKADGSVPGNQRRPSSEWRFHVDILNARPEIGAIVHAHPVYSTALACHRLDIPAFHYMVAVAGGDNIRCARYATFGTQTLSDHAINALIDRRACLLANHGMIATGTALPQALALAVEVETLATQYLQARHLGEPVRLTATEMAEVLERFSDYGAAGAKN